MTPPPHAPQLPVQLTSFVGREQETERLEALVAESRLLTLTGAGGSGKTRLALHVAARVAGRFPDGLAWVELAPLHDATLLPQRVASELGILEEPGRPAVDALRDVLAHRAMLLVLDNCEHLADGCAALADALLRACPGLHVLATSREALGVSGERAWLLPPLSVPEAPVGSDDPSFGRSDALRLFVERAREVMPDFRLSGAEADVAWEICRRLDGLPLAIELAAARVRVLSLEQIRDRLNDSFQLLTSGRRTAIPRHRTLRAAIDWSYALLSGQEKELLQRLSVFAGAFPLEAAETVCAGGSIASHEVLDLLSGLVDRSLLSVTREAGANRYRLLETVRQYALERLREGGSEEAMRLSHARYQGALAESAAPHLRKADVEWLDRVEREHADVRVALDWCLRMDDPERIGLRISGALWWFWLYRVHWGEGLRWLERFLARCAADQAPAARAEVLHGAGFLAWETGDADTARARLRESVAAWRSAGRERGLADALSSLVMAHYASADADPAEVLEWAEEAVRLADRSSDPWDRALALYHGLGLARLLRGELDAADRAFAEAEGIWREKGNDFWMSMVCYVRALVAARQGDVSRELELARAAVAPARHLGHAWAAVRALSAVAVAEAHAGRLERAARLLGAAEARRADIGASLGPSERRGAEEIVARARAGLPEPRFAALRAEGGAMTLPEALAYAESRGEGEPAGPGVPQPAGDTVVDVEAGAFLRVRALGPLEIALHGRPVAPDVWSHAKPRELLLYLLAHPEGRTREQVGLGFWPESSAAQVKNSFHVTLHYLRKALGRPDVVVFEGDRYRINPELDVYFDAAVFEREVPAALGRVRSGDAGAEQRLRRAVALYRGSFLDGESVGDWHLEVHDRLHRLYVDGLGALGDAHFGRAEYAEAAEAYDRLLRREDLREDVHRRLMVCQARLGRRAQALQHYERLVLLLREELDAEPEEETLELYQRLRQTEPV